MKKTIISIITFTAGMVLLAANPSAETKDTTPMVKIDNFSFTPQTLTVRPGTKVVWVNKDDVPHTVTSVEKKFKSRAMDTDERYTFTFTNAGTYKYFCSVHPHMTGKVIVR